MHSYAPMFVVCTLVCELAPRWPLEVLIILLIARLPFVFTFAASKQSGGKLNNQCADDKWARTGHRKCMASDFALFLIF